MLNQLKGKYSLKPRIGKWQCLGVGSDHVDARLVPAGFGMYIYAHGQRRTELGQYVGVVATDIQDRLAPRVQPKILVNDQPTIIGGEVGHARSLPPAQPANFVVENG